MKRILAALGTVLVVVSVVYVIVRFLKEHECDGNCDECEDAEACAACFGD